MQVDSEKITVTNCHSSRLSTFNFESISFGKVFTDHMFSCDYIDGRWEKPHVLPYGPMTLDPSARVFHYGQAVFEGMKAYKDAQGKVFLFRPDENFSRINISAKRLAIPEFPESYFFEGLKTLLRLDIDWIQPGIGNALYIRPFVIATEPSLSATEANQYRFMIICSPAQAYYTQPISVLIEKQFSRSASGGFGYAKAAGNYAGQFYPTKLARERGYDQIIWTDANTHALIEEAGTMNVFFRIDDTLYTAPTSDRILDGITRKSVLALAKKLEIPYEVRQISVSEIVDAMQTNRLKEMFGAGTAAVISPIKAFGLQDNHYELPQQRDSYAALFKKALLDIQYNISEDTFGWRYAIGSSSS